LKAGGLKMSEIRTIKALKTAAVFALIFTTQTRLLAAGDSEKQVLTNRYVFQSDQSTIVQTGGIASVHYTYTVEGQFILNVDFDAHTATFEQVDANAMDDSQYKRTLDPNEVFNMTSLVGIVQDNTTMVFTGKQEGGSTIQLTVTLQDESIHLTGNTTPPPNSADFFIHTMDAIAKQKYSGGTGEPNDPYKIAEPNNWVELMNTSSDWDKNFIMTADIDVNGLSLTPVGTSSSKSFIGVFDGNDHIIYNVDINMPSSNFVGLFQGGSSNTQISNLGLENITITGKSNVGGLVGYNRGAVINCYISGTVSGDLNVGGLVGYNSSGYITNCYSSGMVSGDNNVGGLVGDNWGYITNCYSSGTVSGDLSVGGLVGYNSYGDITNCYSTGMVSGGNDVGGLVGTNTNNGDITNCYSSGTVSGDRYVGGLVGGNSGDITNCYSSGAVDGNYYVRGLVAINVGDVSASFWDIQASGQTTSKGGTGKTTTEMQMRGTFTDSGWDFIGETINGPNDIWWILEGKDYPRLWWQLPVDDFNDSKAEPLWFAYEIEPELAHLEEVNGRLEVYTAGAMEDIDAIYAPYNWGLDANKPFAAKVDFHFSKIGFGDGRMNIGIVPSMNPEAMKWAEFEVGTFDENPFFLYEVRDGQFVEEKVSDRFVDDGTLYVSYDPNSDELYFSNNDYGKEKAIWTISGLIRGRWQTDSVYIILSGGSEDGMALTGQDAWLDNFKVSYGNIWQ
jgi:hypothetical protein